jgi:hypothetical protein
MAGVTLRHGASLQIGCGLNPCAAKTVDAIRMMQNTVKIHDVFFIVLSFLE